MKPILGILLFAPLLAGAQIITTVAGTGVPGDSGLTGPATAAPIGNACGAAFDDQGNFYFSTGSVSSTIKKLTPGGILSSAAGSGVDGYDGDGGPATSARLYQPAFITIAPEGNMYIPDMKNHVIRMVTPGGTISTIAGTGIAGYSGDGGPATAAMLNWPQSVSIGPGGDLYIADWKNNRVRKIDPMGIITTVAGNGTSGASGDGGPATLAEVEAFSAHVDAHGNIFICDMTNHRVRKVGTDGTMSTAVGNGAGAFVEGAPATATGVRPWMVTTDVFDNMVVADNSQRVLLVKPSGVVSTLAGTGVIGFGGDGGPATAAKINVPEGVAFDNCGNLYITELSNSRVRKVTFPYCGFLAVSELSKPVSLSLSPNPVSDRLTIAGTDKMQTIAVTDMMGHIVHTTNGQAGETIIDVANLPNGLYLVRVNDRVAGKFLKQ